LRTNATRQATVSGEFLTTTPGRAGLRPRRARQPQRSRASTFSRAEQTYVCCSAFWGEPARLSRLNDPPHHGRGSPTRTSSLVGPWTTRRWPPALWSGTSGHKAGS